MRAATLTSCRRRNDGGGAERSWAPRLIRSNLRLLSIADPPSGIFVIFVRHI